MKQFLLVALLGLLSFAADAHGNGKGRGHNKHHHSRHYDKHRMDDMGPGGRGWRHGHGQRQDGRHRRNEYGRSQGGAWGSNSPRGYNQRMRQHENDRYDRDGGRANGQQGMERGRR